jgi:hypothetical protein
LISSYSNSAKSWTENEKTCFEFLKQHYITKIAYSRH